MFLKVFLIYTAVGARLSRPQHWRMTIRCEIILARDFGRALRLRQPRSVEARAFII
jgi:hypothetical protein